LYLSAKIDGNRKPITSILEYLNMSISKGGKGVVVD